MEKWGVEHRLSSSYYPQSNGRAELAVKSAKRMLRENTSNGGLDNDKVACAVLQYHNTPLQDGPMSPAQLLFGRALADFLPNDPKAYQLHPHWAQEIEKHQHNRTLHHTKLSSRYNRDARDLQPLRVGQNVAMQDQSNFTKRWNRTGTIVEALPFRKYKVQPHDTGNITIRNRRFLKPTNINSTTAHGGRFSGPRSGPSVPGTSSQDTGILRRDPEETPREQPPPRVAEDTEVTHNENEPLALRRLRPFNAPGLKER